MKPKFVPLVHGIVLPMAAVVVLFVAWKALYASPSALFMAATRGTPDDVRAVLRRGVGVNARDELGSGPALLQAAAAGRVDNIDALLASGADINATNQFGHTAVALAASRGHTEAVVRLLKAGADPTIRDRRGHDAADLALKAGRKDIAGLFNPWMHVPVR